MVPKNKEVNHVLDRHQENQNKNHQMNLCHLRNNQDGGKVECCHNHYSSHIMVDIYQSKSCLEIFTWLMGQSHMRYIE